MYTSRNRFDFIDWWDYIYIFTGDYVASSQIVCTCDNITLEGIGNVTITSTLTNAPIITSNTSHYSSAQIPISNVSAGDTTITVSDASGLIPGDVLKISDQTKYGTLQLNNGELVKILSITETTLILNASTYDGYTSSPVYRKIEYIKNIRIKNINFVGAGINTSSMCITFYGVYNAHINDCTIENFGTVAIRLIDALNSGVHNCTFRNNYYSVGGNHLGYSVSVGNASDNIFITDSNFENFGMRYIATGGMTGTNISDGLPRHLYIRGCTFENSEMESVNSHPENRGMVTITDCKFIGGTKGVDLNNVVSSNVSNNKFINTVSAVSFEHGSHLVSMNEFFSCTQLIFDGDVLFSGNIIHRSGVITRGTYTGNKITITGNTFSDFVGNGMFVSDVSPYNTYIIKNNIFKSVDNLNYFINVTSVRNLIVHGNTIEGNIQCVSCDDVSIKNNEIAYGVRGIRIINAAGDTHIKDNEIDGDVYGISLESSGLNESNIMLRGNKITSPTEIYNQSGYYTSIDSDESNAGTATLILNTTSITVTHGLAATPTNVTATPKGNIGACWVDTYTATTFIIHCSNAPTVNVDVNWTAIV